MASRLDGPGICGIKGHTNILYSNLRSQNFNQNMLKNACIFERIVKIAKFWRLRLHTSMASAAGTPQCYLRATAINKSYFVDHKKVNYDQKFGLF